MGLDHHHTPCSHWYLLKEVSLLDLYLHVEKSAVLRMRYEFRMLLIFNESSLFRSNDVTLSVLDDGKNWRKKKRKRVWVFIFVNWKSTIHWIKTDLINFTYIMTFWAAKTYFICFCCSSPGKKMEHDKNVKKI